eukprot:m51a1_g9037 hypothetical protein (773) ;mRNA; r:243758-249396
MDSSSTSAASRRKLRLPVYVFLLALVTVSLSLVTIGAITTTVSVTDKTLRQAAVQRSSMVSEEIAALVGQQLRAAESTSLMLSSSLAHAELDPVVIPGQFENYLLRLVVSHQFDTSGLILVQQSWDPAILLLSGMLALGPPGSGSPYMLWRTNSTTLQHCAWTVDPDTMSVLGLMFCDMAVASALPYWGESRTAAVNGSCFRVSTINRKTGDWIGYTSANLDVGGLSAVMPGGEFADGITFLVERNTSLFLRSTDTALNCTYVDDDGFTRPLPVSEVDNAMVHEADREVRSRFGSWASAEEATFWLSTDLVVSIVPIERRGLSWISVSVTRPKLSGVQWETIVVTVAIWLAGAVTAGLVSLLISVPVRNLSKDMASLCALQFRGLRTKHKTMSRVSEMCTMQESFLSLRSAVLALSKYIPPQVVLSIMKSHTGTVERYMRTRYLGIMFADLQGFTTLSECVPLPTLNHVLNTWFEEMGKVVESNGGTIDKVTVLFHQTISFSLDLHARRACYSPQFIGDAILALFGAPDEIADPVRAACQTAVEMIDAMKDVDGVTDKLQLSPLKFRIGLHCGPVLVGNIGSHSRINYTVNIASRMEGLGKEYGVTPLVSGAVVEKVSAGFVYVFLDVVSLRGKTSLTRVYHLACTSSTATGVVLAAQTAFDRIHEHIKHGRTEEALSIIEDRLRDSSSATYHQALRVLMKRIENGELKGSVYDAVEEAQPDKMESLRTIPVMTFVMKVKSSKAQLHPLLQQVTSLKLFLFQILFLCLCLLQ